MFTDPNNQKSPSSNDFLSRRHSRKSFLKTLLPGIAGVAGLTGMEDFLEEFVGEFGELRAEDEAIVPGSKNMRIQAPGKSVIYIFLQGGMSQIDTLDPKKGSVFRTISSSIPGAPVTDLLPLTAKELKRVNLLRGLNSHEGNHQRGTYLMHTARTPLASFRDIPSLGSVLAYAHRTSGTYFPGHITMGSRGGIIGEGGFLGNRYESYHVGDVRKPLSNMKPAYGRPSEARMLRRELLLDTIHDSFRSNHDGEAIRQWRSVSSSALDFMNSEKLNVFNLEEESEKTKARYGDTWIGQALLLARRLARIGVPFIEISYGGWDTHKNHTTRMRELWKDLDPALSALLGDLGSSGLMDQTAVLMSGEFGRTPKLASNGDGRDHYPGAWSGLLGGAGLGGGRVLGATDPEGKKVIEGAVSPANVITEIYTAMGIKPDTVLKNPEGRPFALVDHPKRIFG